MEKPITTSEVRRLSQRQRDLMIAHIDREVDVIMKNNHLAPVRNSLMRIGMLKGATQGDRPRATVLTERGRQVVCIILGQCADALMQSQMADENQMAILLALKEKIESGAQRERAPY